MRVDVIVGGPGAARRHSFDRGEVRLGSAPDCDVVLGGEGVAPVHAVLRRDARGWLLARAVQDAELEVSGQRVRAAVLGPLTQAALGGARVTLLVSDAKVGAREAEHGARKSVRSSVPLGEIERIVDALAAPAATRAPASHADAAHLLRLVHDAALALVAQTSIDAVLESIVDLVYSQIEVERALLLLGEGRADSLVPAAFRARRSAVGEGATFSRSIADHALSSRRALLVDVELGGLRFDAGASIEALSIRSALCAPLAAEGRVIGLLYADRTERSFAQGELESFTILAHLSAAALARRGLEESLRRERGERARLSRYLDAAVVEHVLAADKDAGMLAEEREVTVLFADVVGFTALCTRVDAVRLQWLLNRVLEALTEEVFREQGTLDKFIGDEVMAFFGAPLVQPDHALRAVRTALAMQRRIEALRSEAPELDDLSLRVGVNTGKVLVGEIGARARRDYTVVGDAVNVAKRLQAEVAGRGEVVVDEATHAHAAPALLAEALPEAAVRGRVGALRPFRVLGLRGGPA